MKLTAEDYNRHYRELTDDEFLAINRDDLVDMARRCYDAEFARRQLAPEPLAALEPEVEVERGERTATAAATGDLIQVGAVADYEMAMYAQRLLHEADIPASLAGPPRDDMFRIMVPSSCAESAHDLLAGPLTESNKVLAGSWIQNQWMPEGMDLTDFSVMIDDLFGEGEKVAVRFTVEGVNPQTGRDVKFGGIAIVRVVGGKIGDTWIKLDV